MSRYQSALKWAGLLVFFIMMTGCAWDGAGRDIVSTEKAKDREYSADEVRRITLDHPKLLSGDYFMKRSYPPEEASAEENLESRVQKLEKKMEGGESLHASADRSSGGERNPAPIDSSYPLKIGFCLGRLDMTSPPVSDLIETADNVAAEKGLYFFNHPSIHEFLATTDCMKRRDYKCMAQNLGLYPGVRMLIVAEKLEIPDNMPGSAAIHVTLLDTGLVYQYPEMEITSRLENRDEVARFLRDAMTRVFAYAMGRAEIMPMHCRVFSVKKDYVYISAGQASGVTPGTKLKFVSGGETVKSQTGLLVGWLPGKEKGVIQVEAQVGRDAAACTLLEGEMPDQGSYVFFSSGAGSP